MSKLSCCLTVMIAGLVVSSGAFAQELDVPKNNLGVATISAAQSEAGFLALGPTTTGVIVLSLGALVVFKVVDGIESVNEAPVQIPPPNTCCAPITHH